jgi:hypothetical protein
MERMAATGLGVREISRRTGFNPSTISRWLRINGRAKLKEALENDRIDIARAVVLVEAPDTALETLIEQAPRVSAVELRHQVACLRRKGREAHVTRDDRRHLMDALRSLRAVASTNEDDLIQSIRLELERLSPAHRGFTRTLDHLP